MALPTRMIGKLKDFLVSSQWFVNIHGLIFTCYVFSPHTVSAQQRQSKSLSADEVFSQLG